MLELVHCPDAMQCCVCLLCCCTLCLGQWDALCRSRSGPGLAFSHKLLWGLTACLPWTPFPWRFCMVWRWLPVDGQQLYWISSAAIQEENGGKGDEKEKGEEAKNWGRGEYRTKGWKEREGQQERNEQKDTRKDRKKKGKEGRKQRKNMGKRVAHRWLCLLYIFHSVCSSWHKHIVISYINLKQTQTVHKFWLHFDTNLRPTSQTLAKYLQQQTGWEIFASALV